jgi:hypothetical protein
MFNFGTDLRLGPISGALPFTQRPMPMSFGLDEARGLWGVLLNDLTLSAVGGIALYSPLIAVQEIR